MPKTTKKPSWLLRIVALSSGLLLTASAQAQCCMYCPNGAGTSDALVKEFSTVPRAQAGCHGDEIVWVQDKPRVYHRAGWPKFGKTSRGAFVCKASLKRVHVPKADFFQRFL